MEFLLRAVLCPRGVLTTACTCFSYVCLLADLGGEERLRVFLFLINFENINY